MKTSKSFNELIERGMAETYGEYPLDVPSIIKQIDENFESLHPKQPNEIINKTFKARVHIVPEYAQADEPFMPHHYNQLLRVLIEIRDELENIADKS